MRNWTRYKIGKRILQRQWSTQQKKIDKYRKKKVLTDFAKWRLYVTWIDWWRIEGMSLTSSPTVPAAAAAARKVNWRKSKKKEGKREKSKASDWAPRLISNVLTRDISSSSHGDRGSQEAKYWAKVDGRRAAREEGIRKTERRKAERKL